MPFDRHDLVFVLQSLYDLDLVQVHGVADVQQTVVARTRQLVAVYRVRDASNLLRVQLLSGKTLSHVQVPY